ncbi:transglutaminaseTgpA domain-containing protein [Rathayibacter soli]|uniref:transglutaminaseTgpA domain-containing protein n=1 Tax=Rathayibacter soli TaxID=3144168 RepID=UPI0027E4B8EB|nr:transglutaminaseTgpA domain-containing protein [Glaciibacter superstes]
MSTTRMLTTTLFAAVAVACASLTLWPTYHSVEFVIMAATTIVIGCCIAMGGAIFRWSSAIVATLTICAYLVFGVALAVPGEAIAGVLPSGQGVLDLVAGAALGWKQLVTISTPVGAYQALLVPAFLLILLTSVVAVTVALRARRGEWALIAPVLLFAIGIVLGPQSVDTGVVASLALTVVLLLWLARFRRIRRSAAMRALREKSSEPRRLSDGARAGARSIAAAGLVVVLAGGVGAAAAILVPPAGQRDVARNALAQPFDPRDYPSPLTGFRSYLEPAQVERPMLTVSGLDGERRIRIATMDTYDGVVYAVGSAGTASASGTFARVPGQLSQPTASGSERTLQITVDDYRGVWLPGTGIVHDVRFAGPDAQRLQNSVYFNSVTGTVAVAGGVRADDQYRLQTSIAPVRSIAQLATQTPGNANLPKLGVVPDGIDQAVQLSAGADQAPGAKLTAALTHLVNAGYISHGIGPAEPVSRSGHGADRITQLLTDVPMVGDQEQYAVTAALMARQLGFPARVVFGFLVPGGTSTSSPVTLTGADVSAWIEVQTSQSGWVTVDPNPAVRPIPAKQPQDPKQISRPQSVVPPPQDTLDRPAPPSQPSRVAPDNSPTPNALLSALLFVAQIAGWSILGIAIVLAPFAAVLVAKGRRRHRRKNAETSARRITGGWREFADSAIDHGYRPPSSATRSEVAHTVGGVRPLVLATVADRAVFAPDEPSQEEAERVWRAVDELRASLDKDKTRWQRIRAAVSLASFGGYRGGDTKGDVSR